MNICSIYKIIRRYYRFIHLSLKQVSYVDCYEID